MTDQLKPTAVNLLRFSGMITTKRGLPFEMLIIETDPWIKPLGQVTLPRSIEHFGPTEVHRGLMLWVQRGVYKKALLPLQMKAMFDVLQDQIRAEIYPRFYTYRFVLAEGSKHTSPRFMLTADAFERRIESREIKTALV